MKRVLLLFVLLLAVAVPVFAQTHSVTGKILDEKGQGFPGAGITVRGMQIGTVTDVNGDFMLEVPDGDNAFIIQAVGYTTRIAREEDGTVVAKLVRMSKELEGTVVTAQALRREKRELGYNATTLNNDEITSANNYSALSSLAGKVAGINVTSSTGGPGGSTRVVARGEKSILKDNNMLIVVNGVISNNYDRLQDPTGLAQVDFGNSANDIDPDEIETMNVLPGPAASVLYGAAGANGAIMITTKAGKHNVSGKPSKMEVTYKATYMQSDVLKIPDMQHQFGQGNIYNGVVDDRRENFSWGYKFDGAMRPWGQAIDGKQLVKPYLDQPNNVKNFYNRGKDLNNFVSVAGGTDKSTYFLSLNSVNTSGVIPNTFYNKYSVRFNGTTQLTNNFYSGVNINYLNTYSRAETGGQGAGSVTDNLLQTPRDIPLWELADYGNKYYSQQYTDTAGVERYGQYGAYTKNPYWAAKNYDNRNKSDRVLGDFKVGYKKGEFNVFNRTGIDVTSDRSSYKTPNLDGQPVDPFYAGLNSFSAGGYAESKYNGFRLYNDLIANFNHQLSRNFGMNAILGHNVSIKTDESLSATIDPGTNGLVIPNFYNFSNNVGPISAANSMTRQRSFALYADFMFNYQRELFLEVTGRNDWSSTLPDGRNSYFYPGANASWVFTERLQSGTFKEKVLNYGKVRFGAGGVGNSPTPYANNSAGFTQSAIRSGFGSVIPPVNGVPAYQVQNVFGNNNLKPEQTHEMEIGTDLSFFRDRIAASFTYYNILTRNLITMVPTAPSSGFTSNYVNVGDITNRGIEVSLRGTPISTRYGLKWDLFGTYTRNRNNVVSLNGNVDHVVLGGYDGMNVVAAVGRPFGTFYAADIQYVMHNGKFAVLVDQATGLPIATKNPIYAGSYQPKFQASWGTDLSYKGLKLHALFTTKQGSQFYSRNKMVMDFTGTSEATTVNNREKYVWANSVYQVANTNILQTNTTKFSPYTYYTTTEQQSLPGQGIVNGSYVRLQELALSYKIPQKYYQRSPFGGLEAGLFGTNLFLWTAESNKYDDPEATSSGATGNAQGFNYTARPSVRNYGFFVKVNF